MTHLNCRGANHPRRNTNFLKGRQATREVDPKALSTSKSSPARSLKRSMPLRSTARSVRKTLLQLVIEFNGQGSRHRRALDGRALSVEIRAKVSPTQDEQKAGFLLVPAELSPEEFIAQEEARNANAQDPTTYVNHKGEEMCKASRGIDSPLGEALLAFHRRWG